jgi:hypothetical protein
MSLAGWNQLNSNYEAGYNRHKLNKQWLARDVEPVWSINLKMSQTSEIPIVLLGSEHLLMNYVTKFD